MFRGNAGHTGVYSGAGVPQFSKIKWQFQTHGQVLSSPAVTADTVYIGSNDHFLYALDRASGTQKWKFKTDGRITSSPAAAAGVVYFGSWDGNFYAVDAVKGDLKWKFALPGERRFAATHLHGSAPAAEVMPDPFDFYLSSPVVWNGAVYFGSGDTNVYALDATSGQLKWKFKTGDVVHASPAIANGTLFVGSWDSYFYALDAATGKEKWRFKTGEDPEIHNQVGIQSSAAVADGVVYFGCRDSNFYAVDASSGKERWRFNNKGSWVIGSPAVNGGKVYFATSDSALFHALDAKTGAETFSLELQGLAAVFLPRDRGRHAVRGIARRQAIRHQFENAKAVMDVCHRRFPEKRLDVYQGGWNAELRSRVFGLLLRRHGYRSSKVDDRGSDLVFASGRRRCNLFWQRGRERLRPDLEKSKPSGSVLPEGFEVVGTRHAGWLSPSIAEDARREADSAKHFPGFGGANGDEFADLIVEVMIAVVGRQFGGLQEVDYFHQFVRVCALITARADR